VAGADTRLRHDHPYDPFTQRDFYALTAVFNNADEAEIELPDATDHDAQPMKFRVLASRETPRVTRLLKRGEFQQPGDEVMPGVLPGLHPLNRHQTDGPPDRLDLARWLVDPANPLTPRVMANQVWLKLFGRGLVRTPEDFGARGEIPTHPDLLDWLAMDLLTNGSRKRLIRVIVSSATYRQASSQSLPQAAVDPENRLLARQNRIRVEAEIVRDLHLEVAGLLDRRIGGPSVHPPLDPEFAKITFRSQLPWKTSTGGNRYRRGLYTFFKRSVPYPDLMLFDCPDATSAAHQRSVTNTPLQALATLNSESSLDAARGLARRMVAERSNDGDDFLQSTMQICLTRPPTKSELARLAELHSTHEAWYAEHPEDARELARDLPSDFAAFVATANVILNLDELITRE
jgi:hypothetical protein